MWCEIGLFKGAIFFFVGFDWHVVILFFGLLPRSVVLRLYKIKGDGLCASLIFLKTHEALLVSTNLDVGLTSQKKRSSQERGSA